MHKLFHVAHQREVVGNFHAAGRAECFVKQLRLSRKLIGNLALAELHRRNGHARKIATFDKRFVNRFIIGHLLHRSGLICDFCQKRGDYFVIHRQRLKPLVNLKLNVPKRKFHQNFSKQVFNVVFRHVENVKRNYRGFVFIGQRRCKLDGFG